MRGEQFRAIGAALGLVLVLVLAVVVGIGLPGLIGFLLGRATA